MLMRSYRSLFVFKDSNLSLSIFIGLICSYGFLWVLMGFYKFLCVLINFNGSQCVLMGPYECLWVLISLKGPYSFL